MKELRLIGFKELKIKVGASWATIERWEKMGNFPKRINIGDNSVRWLLSDIDEWILNKANKKD